MRNLSKARQLLDLTSLEPEGMKPLAEQPFGVLHEMELTVEEIEAAKREIEAVVVKARLMSRLLRGTN